MATRHPLGSSIASNVRTGERKHADPDSVKLKKALEDIGEERRKRSEAEAVAHKARRETVAVQESISQLRRDLDRAQSRIAKRDEQIAALNPTGISDLEAKLGELMKRYEASKKRHQEEIDIHKQTNSTLQSNLNHLKVTHERTTNSNSELRKAFTDLESENGGLKRELDIMRRSWLSTEDKVRLEEDKNSMVEEMERLKIVEEDSRALQEENETLKGLLKASAVNYQLLHESSEMEIKHREDNLELKQVQQDQLQDRVHELQNDLEDSRQEVAVLHGRMMLLEEERDIAVEMAQSRPDDMLLDSPSRELVDQPLEHDENNTNSQILDLTIRHIELTTTYYHHQRQMLFMEISDLESSLQETTSKIQQTSEQLLDLDVAHRHLQSLHSSLEKSHSSCAGEISEIRADLSRAVEIGTAAEKEVDQLKVEIRDMGEKARHDKESLKRANESVMRWKSAETALEEEIYRLKESLLQAEKWESLYLELEERHRVSISRETMALEEVQVLSQQNAELIGHSNGVQKINYVEGVRREMAMVKQELAETRALLNTAQDHIRLLETEIQAYKYVDPSNGNGGVRTKVVRRQPEGSQLTLSTSKSMGNVRSVSGSSQGARR